MDIFLSVFYGFLVYLFFRFIERYFSRYYFYFSDLVIGDFSKTSLILTIIIPLASGLLVGFTTKSDSLALFALPGFIGALLTVWPNVARPELLPFIKPSKRYSYYTSYFLFTVSFSAFSYIGGLCGKYVTLQGLAPSKQGLVDNVWGALVFGLISLLIKWVKTRK